jgi:parallel beta helix pectate lyase-like protein
MKNIALLTLLILASCENSSTPSTILGICEPVPTALYVATTGDDQTGDGSESAPWATISKAAAVIEDAGWAATAATDIVVLIGGGNYYDTAITFGAANSGRNSSARVVYRQKDGNGTAHLWGGHPITGWTLHNGNVYKAPVASAFSTMWENGVRATRARSPNRAPGIHYPAAFAPYHKTLGVDSSQTMLEYDPMDFDPSNWALGDVRLFAWGAIFGSPTAWFADIVGATALNTSTKRFTLGNGGLKFYAYSSPAGARYNVQGPLPLLDEAGEFTVTGGYVYYQPRNTPIGDQTIIAPSTQDVVSFLGTDDDTRVHDIVLDGLDIEYSDFSDTYSFGYCGTPGCSNTNPTSHDDQAYDYFWEQPTYQHAGVLIRNANDITITNTHIGRTGLNGVFADDYARAVTISNSLVNHTGGDGIVFHGRYPGEGDVNRDHTISNVKVAYFGELVGGRGIRFSQAGQSVIENFEIHSGPRAAVWVHGEYDVPAEDNYAHDVLIDRGRIHDTGQDSGDHGAVTVSFMSAPTSPATNVNTISNVTVNGAYSHPSMMDYPPNGLFFDNHASGQTVTNMLIINTLGEARRYNDSSGATVANVSFSGSFTEGALDFARIGIRSNHPYRATDSYTFDETFEGTFSAWTSASGTPTTISTQAHDGTKSFNPNENGEVIYRFFPERLYGHVSVWFYDDASDTSCDSTVRFDDKVYNASTGSFYSPAVASGWRSIGVSTSESTTKYIVWAYPSSGATIVTNVTRTTAWHQFEIDYTDGYHAVFSIDGNQVYSAPAGNPDGHAAAQIAIGDVWAAGRTCTVYWDQVEVTP